MVVIHHVLTSLHPTLCEGRCQQWLHRCCAGLTKLSFESLSSESGNPFSCANCKMEAQSSQIAELQSAVADLLLRLSALIGLNQPSSPASVSTPALVPGSVPTESSPAIANPGRTSYTSAAAQSNSQHTLPALARRSLVNDLDRKFNIVVYGIPECDAGTV